MRFMCAKDKIFKGAFWLGVCALLAAPGFLNAAEAMTLNIGDGAFSNRLILLIAILSVLSIAPSLLVMLTSFTRIAVVLSFLRHALGMGQSPPNSVLLSLALFLTFFTMNDALQQAYQKGLAPYMEGRVSEELAFAETTKPFQEFMLRHVGKRELAVFMDMAKVDQISAPQETPLRILIPAFMLTELKRAFEIGFLIFIPFIVIDMIVASVIMSMGMMMLPPTLLSLPLKIIFFVLSDGWALLAGSLVRSYA